jgi:hypothetical protein
MIAFARGAWIGLRRIRMPLIGEHRVERGGEFRVPVADQELDGVYVAVEVHQQVAGYLRHPPVGRMVGHTENPDPAGSVLDDSQHVGAGPVEQIDCEEIGGENRLGLAAEELRPGRAGSSRRRRDSGVGQDLPHCGRCDCHAETGKLTVDPPVAPRGIFRGEAKDQDPDVAALTWATRLPVLRLLSPASTDDVPMPAQHRVRGDDEP